MPKYKKAPCGAKLDDQGYKKFFPGSYCSKVSTGPIGGVACNCWLKIKPERGE